MIVKQHRGNGKLILAVCDTELLGKRFEDSKLVLDLTSSFYKGVEMDENRLRELTLAAAIINAVGEKTIKFLRDCGFEIKEVNKIKNIPFVNIIF